MLHQFFERSFNLLQINVWHVHEDVRIQLYTVPVTQKVFFELFCTVQLAQNLCILLHPPFVPVLHSQAKKKFKSKVTVDKACFNLSTGTEET